MSTVTVASELERIEGLRTRTNVPLARLTTFKVGGEASVLVTPESTEALAKALVVIRESEIPLFVLGNGSNILVSDEGFAGVVLRVGSALGGVEPVADDVLRVGAGTLWSKVLRHVMKEGVTGLEWGAGIPGTIGGAVATNAGTRGGDTAGSLLEATVVQSDGSIETWEQKRFRFVYRNAELPENAVVASATFRVAPEDPDKVTETVRGYQAERRRDQPEREPSAGCIFKNPEGGSAGRMIDEAGLKGESVGGAIVSPVHGNFIINKGGATSNDVLRLIDRIRERISREHGVELSLEVRKVGFE